jgi:lactoylglutathione lyase
METVTQNVKQAVPFFMINNMEASLRYYVDGLGFTMTNKWIPRGKIEWCWLQRDGAAIMLQEPNRASHEYKEPEGKPGLGVSICFQCEDALALYKEFEGRGIKVREPFVGNNMWVITLIDPDGYNLDFESATDVPEETKYSDWAK